MKKILIVMALMVIVIANNKVENIVIPESSIRFRVIANSSNLKDQKIKNDISINLSSYLYSLIKEASSKKEADQIINENYYNIDNYVDNYFKKNNIDTKYELSIGRNYFPQKTYRNIKYNSGYYDSIVLSLGNKQGVNWWCVMYPPLCQIDEKNDVQYTTLIKDMLKKYNS